MADETAVTAATQEQSGPASSPPGLAFVLAMVFADRLSMGMALPAVPELVRRAEGGSLAEASGMIGVVGAAYALTLTVFAPAVGSLSDRVGRRPVLLVSMPWSRRTFLPYRPASRSWEFLWPGGWVVCPRLAYPQFTHTWWTFPRHSSGPATSACLEPRSDWRFTIGPAVVGGGLASLDGWLLFLVAGLLAAVNAVWGWWTLVESLPPQRTAKPRTMGDPPLGRTG